MNPLNYLIIWLVLIPLFGYGCSLVVPKDKEAALSWVALGTLTMQLLLGMVFAALWAINGFPEIQLNRWILYHNHDTTFQIDFLIDEVSMVYLLVGVLLTFLIIKYSRVYLHREAGYKRFFNTILFFYLGYNLAVLSGNMETLFLGWEVLGISSFLLISFYRERYLPSKNAVKIFSIYRIGDVGILLAMWLSHHLWHANITFQQLAEAAAVQAHLREHSWIGVIISLMILLAAIAKSAQFPFSSWLPRAMEGPTPSSAIFYGSLSVHMGLFLMIRTFPFWEYQSSIRVLIGLGGILTTLLAAGTARVQSSVKSQIAYASIAQIGLMFLEISLGWKHLALFHFAGNAFLRTYQLLVSPSVVSYLIKEQFYQFSENAKTIESSYPQSWRNTFYLLCLKEWNMDLWQRKWLWGPLKKLGNQLHFLNFTRLLLLFIPLIGLISYLKDSQFLLALNPYLPVFLAALALLLVLKSFAEKRSIRLSWALVFFNHLLIALAVSFNEAYEFQETLTYLSGILVAGLIGFITIHRLFLQEGKIRLGQFHGLAASHPKMALVFLLASLGMTGFPISPTFIGEDIVFSHIKEQQWVLASLVALSFVLDGLAVIRIYSRIFLGPHYQTDLNKHL